MKALGALAPNLDWGPSQANCRLTHCILRRPRGLGVEMGLGHSLTQPRGEHIDFPLPLSSLFIF